MFCKLQDPPRYVVDEESARLFVKRLELALYLRRLCVAFMVYIWLFIKPVQKICLSKTKLNTESEIEEKIYLYYYIIFEEFFYYSDDF